MRVIVNQDVLRQFERKTGTTFGLLHSVVDAAAPLDTAKLRDIVNELTSDRFNLAIEFLSQRKRRNQVDYSPYPEGNLHALAQRILLEAQDFLDICAHFLRGRGVPHV